MKKLLLLIGISSFLGSTYAETAKEESTERGMRRRGPRIQKIFKELNLTKEQKEKLKKQRKEELKKRSKTEKEIHEARQEMQNSFASTKSNKYLKKLHQKFQNLRNKMADLRFEKTMKLRSILTLEQRKKFTEIMKPKRNKQKMGRRGRGGAEKRGTGRKGEGRPRGMGHSEGAYGGEI